MATDTISLSGLARRLVDDQLLDAETAARSSAEARLSAVPLVSYLVRNQLVDSKVVAARASEEFGVPLFDLEAFDAETIPRGLVKDALIKKHHALPLLRRGNRLSVMPIPPAAVARIVQLAKG